MVKTSEKRKGKARSKATKIKETSSPLGLNPTLTPEGMGTQEAMTPPAGADFQSPTFTPEGLGIAPPPQPTAPEIPPEVRDELTGIMQELLLKTHELSFEYSTLDCSELHNCPLALKSRELFKVVKELNRLVKKMTPPATPPPVV